MSKFSDRMGITKPKIDIQIKSMDDELRNRLWSYFSLLLTRDPTYNTQMSDAMARFAIRLWDSVMKAPIDNLPRDYTHAYQRIRDHFFQIPWFDVYNLLEFTAQNYPTEEKIPSFTKNCNQVLESELSGYRFVGNQIVPITAQPEIETIKKAMETPLAPVNLHIENAVKQLSDKQHPDYRTSIKESISAVEAICRLIVKNDKATLGDALNTIERENKVELHGALKRAFSALYGYTSSADGIRHAFSDERITSDFEEAKFMLVTCSAFVNYLVSKAAKAGIKLGKND